MIEFSNDFTEILFEPLAVHFSPSSFTKENIEQLVDVVQFIHSKDFIHRDIRPMNIMNNKGIYLN